MTFKHISNNPEERQRIIQEYCYWNNAFNEDEMQRLEKYLNTLKLERGFTIAENQKKNIKKTIRKSKVNFIKVNPETVWIFERINFVISNLNNNFFNFDLNGYNSLQYTVYNASEKGEYGFHMDTFIGNDVPKDMYETRKLSLTFLLNEPNVDFKGGEFQINPGDEKKALSINMKKGDMILFPSFMIHRVKPVTKGVRKSIVAWVTGPKWR